MAARSRCFARASRRRAAIHARARGDSMTDDLYTHVQRAATSIREQGLGTIKPAVGLILGSGLGGYADKLGGRPKTPGLPRAIEYGDIPYFHQSHVVGHQGR